MHDGIQTNFVGNFLMIPYLQQLGIGELVKHLGLNSSGIPVLNDVLMWVNLALVGKRRAAKIKDLSDDGLAIASGLPVNPDQSQMHRFLKRPNTENVDRLIRAIGKRQYEIGQIDGSVVSFDPHLIRYNGKVDIQKDSDGKARYPFKAIKVNAVLDQRYRNPIYLMACYPGKTAVEIGDILTDATLAIISDKSVVCTMDKWFSVGELLAHLRLKGQKFVTLLRRHQNRIKEMEKIPLESFRRLTATLGVTSIKTTIRNYCEDIRLIVVDEMVDKVRTLYGYLTNDDGKTEEETIEIYSNRWGIEFWFDEENFFGLSDLSSIELNEVTMHLAVKLIAYNLISAFRANLGGEYIPMNAETIYEKFFKEQALIKLREDQITVTMYGHRHREILEPLFHDLNSKLKSKGIDPKVPWLNNHTLKFEFK
ncbi:MAG: transposase [bacterium]